MIKIAVTGYPGQLASELKFASANYEDIDIHFFSKKEWNIINRDQNMKVLCSGNWNVLINCAAYTQVDQAETRHRESREVNHHAVENLACICAENNVHLIHLSTDYVYGSRVPKAVDENATTHPINVYAQTKLAGEQAIEKAGGNATVIRTSWVYSRTGHNFVKTMVRLITEKNAMRIVSDQWGCPTSARELAYVILEGIQTKKLLQSGYEVYNYTEEGWTNWYEMACFIESKLEVSCRIVPIVTRDYPTAAFRPTYSLLDCKKIAGLALRERLHWTEAMETCLKQLMV